jgi:hypothetical protein
MRRELTALAMATGMAVAIAGPVAAWSSIAVVISDDEGGQTISVTGDVMAPALLVAPTLEGRPTGDLGARFTATYSMGPGGRVLAIQELYPYASGGPVTYTTTAGAIGEHPYGAGWRQADAAVLQVLVAWGLPAPDAEAAPNNGSEAGRPTATGTGGSLGEPVSMIVLGWLTVSAVAAVLLTALRRRSAERRAA